MPASPCDPTASPVITSIKSMDGSVKFSTMISRLPWDETQYGACLMLGSGAESVPVTPTVCVHVTTDLAQHLAGMLRGWCNHSPSATQWQVTHGGFAMEVLLTGDLAWYLRINNQTMAVQPYMLPIIGQAIAESAWSAQAINEKVKEAKDAQVKVLNEAAATPGAVV